MALMAIDPEYAQTLHPNHSQRISRALEVFRSSGKTMSWFRQQQDQSSFLQKEYRVIQLALVPSVRADLHANIEWRFKRMLEQGFEDEVKSLIERGDLHENLPSIRSVGYRQVWQYLHNEFDHDTMIAKGVSATRQLAKRQLTWLRGWPNLVELAADADKKQKNLEQTLNFLSKESI